MDILRKCRINKDIISNGCNFNPKAAAGRAYFFNRKDIDITKIDNLIINIQNIGTSVGYSLDTAKSGAIDFGHELVQNDNLPDYYSHFVKFPVFENDSESLLNIDKAEDLVIIIETTVKQFFAFGVCSGLYKSVDTDSGIEKDIEYKSDFELFSIYEVKKVDYITTKELLEGLLENIPPLEIAATFMFNQVGDQLSGTINTLEGVFDIMQGSMVQRFNNGIFLATIDPLLPITIKGSVSLFAVYNQIKDITFWGGSYFSRISADMSGYAVVNSSNWEFYTIDSLTSAVFNGSFFGKLTISGSSTLTQSNIDSLLIQADNSNSVPNSIVLDGTSMGTPSISGYVAKNSLISKGWTVLTN
jgi:hypothetical protein